MNKLSKFILICLLSVFCFSAAAKFSGVHLNLTKSAPRGLYIEVDEPITRGSLVAACINNEHLAYALERGYLHPGQCPGGIEPVLKSVLALGGDVVRVTPLQTFVNSNPISNSAMTTTDSLGRYLNAREEESRLLPSELFLFSNYAPNSWDSRYFGVQGLSNVLAVVKPVLVVD